MPLPNELANYLGFVKPKEVRFLPSLLTHLPRDHLHHLKAVNNEHVAATSNYSITSVSPTLITNDDIVSVGFNSTAPGENDWIGAYSPADADISSVVPVKWGYCKDAQGDYLSSGSGLMTFNMTNLRADFKFYYFTGGPASPVNVANSDTVVTFANLNQPLRNRVVPTGDPNTLQLLWSSYNSTSPTLQWGTTSGSYPYTMAADTVTVDKSQMCGAPANNSGWRDLGLIHKANISGILDLSLSNTQIYYRFGDVSTNDFSPEVVFLVPPAKGTQPPNRPTQVVVMADLGVGSTDTSYDTNTWDEYCPPAINTTMSITQHIIAGEIDAVFLSGDIAYADGFLATWDFFLDMISPLAGGALFLNTVGNHESDWPGTTTNPGYGDSSGGECGVVSTTMLPQPTPSSLNMPYWSYDVGLIHFVGMSTEHNYTIGSPQYKWIENDLKQVNRSVTPWIVFSGHRPMYVSSSHCCEGYFDDDCIVCAPGTDVEVMVELQDNIEPLLYKYQVNLAFAGHFHDLQRQSAVYQNKVVQASTTRYIDGNKVAYYDNPNATVWMLVGSAGNGPSYADYNYTWSEKYWDNVWGYAIITAVNSTYMTWQLINSANNEILDRVTITQDFEPWSVTVDDKNDNGSNGVSTLDIALASTFSVCVVGLIIALVIRNYVIPFYAKSKPKEFTDRDGLSKNEVQMNAV
eukprot:gene36154-43850_t